jgi:hypothetical protein
LKRVQFLRKGQFFISDVDGLGASVVELCTIEGAILIDDIDKECPALAVNLEVSNHLIDVHSEPVGCLHSSLVVDVTQTDAVARRHSEDVPVPGQPDELGDWLCGFEVGV